MWYEARAVAEQAKSLAWRYAVFGPPFDRRDETLEETNQRFVDALTPLSMQSDMLDPPELSGEISESMRSLRTDPDEAIRRRAFVHRRLEDQLSWYAARARRDDAIATRWDITLYAVIAVAVLAGAFLASHGSYSRWLGPVISLAAGASGAIGAWVAVRRFSNLATSYRGTARQLSLLAALAPDKDTPEEWSSFVAQIEDLINHEHAQWLSMRR
jgi:hypothetical protein